MLTDGASAIYGSDAVGGVINFILKSDYEGISVDGRLGFADGYKERSASFVFGHELTEGLNVTIAGTYLNSDPLYQNQRSFTSPFYSTATAVPGSVVNSGLFGVLANGINSPSQRNPTGVLATAPNFAALVANGTYLNLPTTTSPQTTPPTATSNIGVVGTGIGGTYDLSQYQTLLLEQEQKALDFSLNWEIVPAIIRVETLNGSIDYTLPTTNMGTFNFSSIMAVFLSYKFQVLPSQPFYEYAGTATNGGTGVQGTLPKFRAYSQINWNYHDFDVTIGNTYISGVDDLGVGGVTFETNAARTPPTSFVGKIKPYTTFDLRLGYTARDLNGIAKGFSIAVGVNNVFDRMPPISTNVFTPSAAYTDNTADVSTYSPIGRLGYVQASIKF